MSRRATGGLLQDGAAPQRRAVRLTRNKPGLEVARSTATVKLK